MRFKTDENLPLEVADILVSNGHDAVRVDEQRLAGATDSAIAAVCLVERRAIVTLDTDFMDVRRFPPERYEGIIVLRPHRQTIPRIVALSRRFVSLLELERLPGQLWIVDESRVRIRPAE